MTQGRWRIAVVLGPIVLMVSTGSQVPSCRADTPDCVPRRSTGEPAEGTWTGSFRLSYRIKLPAPGLQPIPVTLEGDLTYELTHRGKVRFPSELRPGGDQPSTAQPPGLRRPLGSKAPLPEAPKPKPQPEFVDTEPQIRGTARVGMTTALGYERQGDRASANVASAGRPELEVKEELAEMKDILTGSRGGFPGQITALVGFGDPARFNFGATMSGQTTGGQSMSGRMNVDGRGTASGRLSVRSPRGGYSNTDVSNPGQGRTSAHTEGRGDDGRPFQYDTTTPATIGPGGNRQLLRLEVRERDCWLMKGPVDPKEMTQSMQAAGIPVEIVHSEWTATLDQRDVPFEQAVERFVRAPIPANLTWQYVDGIVAEFDRLRGSNSTDYRRCVLAAAQEKLLGVQVAALKVYLDSYPKVSEGATPAVLSAANVRILGIVQRLDLRGIECPLVTAAWKMINEQAEAAKAKWPDYRR